MARIGTDEPVANSDRFDVMSLPLALMEWRFVIGVMESDSKPTRQKLEMPIWLLKQCPLRELCELYVKGFVPGGGGAWVRRGGTTHVVTVPARRASAVAKAR